MSKMETKTLQHPPPPPTTQSQTKPPQQQQQKGKSDGVKKPRSSRNTEKRRERSKVAARCRRGKESEIFSELSQCLPVSDTSRANLDKASVMRLTLCDLKLKQMIDSVNGFKQNSDDQSCGKNEELFESLINSAVSGFVLVCSCDGDVIYVSEGIANCLGLSQYEVMGQSLLEFSHPCDQADVKEMLLSSEKMSTAAFESKSALFRMKSANSTRGRNVHHRSTNYKVVSCFGRIFSGDEKGGETSKKWFVGICEPLLHPSDVDINLNKQTFLSKHSPDMKFEYVDESISEFMGYTKENMVGKSLFDFYHACDGDGIAKSFRSLYTKGQTVTERSRFLAKGGGWIWVVTQATSINNNAGKPTSVVCIHFVTSGVECEDEIVSHVQIREADEPVIPIRKSVPVVPVSTVPVVSVPEKKPLQESTNLQQQKEVPPIPITTVVPEVVPVAAAAAATSEPLIMNPFILSKPTPSTAKIFAPRTEDMDTGFLMPVNDTLIVTKEEPADLTHLAPIAGDECVPITSVPLLDDLLQWLDEADMEYTVMEGYEEPLPLPLVSAATGGALDSPIPVPIGMTASTVVKEEVNLDTMTGGSLNDSKCPLLMSSSDPTLISTTDPLLLSPFKTASPDPLTSSAASSSTTCLDMMNPDLFTGYYSDSNANSEGGGLNGTAGASSHKSKAGGGYDDDSFSGFPMVSDFQENLFSPGRCLDDVAPPESPPEQTVNLMDVGGALNLNPLNMKIERGGTSSPLLLTPPNFAILNKEPDPGTGQLQVKFAASGHHGPGKDTGEPHIGPEIGSQRPLPSKIAKSSYTDELGNNKVWLQVESVTPPQPPWKVAVPTISPSIAQQAQKITPSTITTGTQTLLNYEKSLVDEEQKRLEERQRQLEQYRQLLMNPVVVQALILNKKLRETSTPPAIINPRKRNFVGKLLGGDGTNLLTHSFSRTTSGGGSSGGGLFEMANPLVELTNQDCEVNLQDRADSHPLLHGPELLTALDTEMALNGGNDCM